MDLIITEKPSVATSIANAIANKQATRATKSPDGECWVVGNYCVTWAFGHLLTLKMPEEYNPQYKKWTTKDLPIIPDKFEYKPISRDHSKRLQIIKRLWKQADTVYCATDAGREGELIFRLIWQHIGTGKTKPVKRMWLQTLTDEGIITALEKAQPISKYDNLYAAGLERSLADWIVGINLTRLVTLQHHEYKQVYSIGRVQTPTLAIIVQREREIQQHKSKIAYRPILVFDEFELACTTTFPNAEAAEQAVAGVVGKQLKLTMTTKENKIDPPLLPSLTDLQREMPWRGAQTLEILQTLYEHKLVSYPRTDSNYLPEDMPQQILKIAKQLGDADAIEHVKSPAKPKRIYDNSKVTDHYAIIPLSKPHELSDKEKELFDHIVARFFSAFYPPAINVVQTVKTTYNNLTFTTQRTSTKEPSWFRFFPDRIMNDTFIPEEKNAQVKSTKIAKVKSNPPSRWTDGTLIDALAHAGRFLDQRDLKQVLSDKGIGTPATRADIIERLIKVGYVQRKGRSLVPTDKGIHLIDWLNTHNMAELTSPKMTALWETRLESIADGKEKPQNFRNGIIQWTRKLCQQQLTEDSERT